jgi:hypothetical protein
MEFLNPTDAAGVGIGTAIGVVSTAVFGFMRFRHAGLTKITLAEMKQREDFMLHILTRLREVETINKDLQNQVLDIRNEEEAKKMEERL